MSGIPPALRELEERVIALYRQGKYPEALAVARESLHMAGKVLGPGHVYVKTMRNNVAQLDRLRRRQEEAWQAPFHPAPARGGRNGFLRAVPVLALTAVVASLLLFAPLFSHPGRALSAGAPPSRPEGEFLPFYAVTARFDPWKRTVEGEQEVTFLCAEAVEELLFNLYFNRYSDPRLDTSEIRRYAFRKGKDRGYIDILRVSCNGVPLSFAEEGEVLRVFPAAGRFSRGKQTLKIAFRVRIPMIADRSGGNADGIWLGHWLPTLKVDPEGRAPTEIGDPFVNLSSTYEVRFTVPKPYTLVLSNIDDVRENADTRIYHARLAGVRDLPVFLNRGYEAAAVTEGGVEIRFYYTCSGSRREHVLSAARKAVAYLQSRVGEYPWRQLNIVENDMYLDGMEYATLILVSTAALRDNPVGTVFHEVAHQWFYNIIGNDQYGAPFLDEGMVEFLTSRALGGGVRGDGASAGDLDKDLSRFSSWQEYRRTHYEGGKAFFHNLCLALGEEKFDRLLREYYARYRFALVSPAEFRRFVAAQAGEDLACRCPDANPGQEVRPERPPDGR
ncbi:MAG: M1 family aminopeptidase [Bacillota bacterium]